LSLRLNNLGLKNTLFVITADHTSEIADKSFNNQAGRYAIPIIYYIPGDSLKGEYRNTTQQIDIMPSILDYINYDRPFYSLGNSVFSKGEHHEAISYNNGIYQYISGDSIIYYNEVLAVPFEKHSLNKWPVLFPNNRNEPKLLEISMENRLKAFIQKYNHDLINNDMRFVGVE
jgi:phosphoglycerol transferase MdoB-like AlkP superfamily enzyme